MLDDVVATTAGVEEQRSAATPRAQRFLSFAHDPALLRSAAAETDRDRPALVASAAIDRIVEETFLLDGEKRFPVAALARNAEQRHAGLLDEAGQDLIDRLGRSVSDRLGEVVIRGVAPRVAPQIRRHTVAHRFLA